MTYTYDVIHSHGEATGSVEAGSQQKAEQIVRDMYHDVVIAPADEETGKPEERTEIISMTVLRLRNAKR
jgi:hypothetical protein